MTVTITWFGFEDLSRHDLHALLLLRQNVFIIEQASLYPDIDGNDPVAVHLLATGSSGDLAGCLRLLPPGVTHDCPAIGRLAISKSFRGQGMGSRLMTEGIGEAHARFAGRAIYLSAQHHLIPFYRELGFAPTGTPYDEDGILHIDMILPAPEANGREIDTRGYETGDTQHSL